ncbi:MAG: cohesin domain-containing protein [Candidatus Cloacimonetes bacterium]|nr:cohesin domain-containing protein [Candidatus Cloacimonadota bacterium]
MKKIILIILSAIMLLSCSNGGTDPKEQLAIMISPAENHIVNDSMVEFVVRIENVSNLFAFSGELKYDSSIVEIQSDQVAAGSFWSIEPLCDCIAETGCLNICIGLTQTNGIDRINGSGTLFTFSLKGINIGQSEISLSNIQLINENGELINNFNELELSSSIVYVESE